jgi:hypothetical protein
MRETEDATRDNPIVAAILAGSAPRPLKISAARGVLPLVRTELLRILVVLLGDGDDQVRREAAAKLSSFAETELLPLLEEPSASPEVLDHFGCQTPGTASYQVAVISNPATSVATLRRMAPSLTAGLIDHLLLNQTRLISTPDLLDLLEGNPALTPLQRSRTAEIRLHFLHAAPPPPAREAAPPFPAEPAKPAPPPATTTEPDPSVPLEPDTAAMISNATQKILRMNTSEKVQLAMKGNREERGILIKDASKVVQEAVMSSPKLTDNEVESFARMRSVTEDVLRIIAANRDWVKNYAVNHALATNPKTPAGLAMNMVTRLTQHDLKLLCADRNVSEVIRRHARRVSETRLKRPGHH